MSMHPVGDRTTVLSKLVSEIRDIRDRHMQDEFHEEEISPFAHLDKASVLQDCRVFHDANFVKMHPKRCCQQLTKLLWFVNQGDTFSGPDAEAVFFGVTKLFQSPDGNLRRMVYLFLRAVADSTESSSLIIVTQSLVKDMFTETALNKGNALRVLAAIVDASMLGQLERYFKQLIVERDEYVSSAALTSSLLLSSKPGAIDVISRWITEVQTILTSRASGPMPQFHALALLRSIKKHDRLAGNKIVAQLIASPPGSRLAMVLLIRASRSMLQAHYTGASELPTATVSAILTFLDSAARHNSDDMVELEAVRALASLPPTPDIDLTTSIQSLRTLLVSGKSVSRYAVLRTLASLAQEHPAAVSRLNEDIEAQLGDNNRTLATLALTILLRTGSEQSVDRLMKSIGSFMSEVGNDELRVSIVKAINELVRRMPGKHRTIMSFLATSLRDEGGYEFKKALVDGLLEIMELIPEAKNEGLFHLCEFIEDCEFTSLATRVLHLLGDQGPATPAPGQFIRYIYNRIILENAAIRASAVTALAKFAIRVPDLRPSILPLIARCLEDDDDDVRDRATLYLRMLGGSTVSANSTVLSSTVTPVNPTIADLTSGVLPLPIHALTKALTLYQLRPSPGPFGFNALPHVDTSAYAPPSAHGGYGYGSEVRAVEAAAAAALKGGRGRGGARGTAGAGASTGAGAGIEGGASGVSAASSGSSAGGLAGSSAVGGAGDASNAAAAEALYTIPEFQAFGSLFRSTRPKDLTEKELEYLVSVVKHIFPNHIVFQFTITNTVPEILLERAAVIVSPRDPSAWTHVASIAAPRIREGAPAHSYVAFQRNPAAGFTSWDFSCELRFNSRECDPTTGEALGDPTPETYPVDPVEVTPADFVSPVPVGDFKAAWESFPPPVEEIIETYSLPIKTVEEAGKTLIESFGLAACEGTGTIRPGTVKHHIYLSGIFLGGIKVLARLLIAVNADGSPGVTLKVGVRSQDRGVCELMLSFLG